MDICDVFGRMVKSRLHAKTKQLFTEGWNAMTDHIPTACAEYIQNRCTEPYKEKFFGACISRVKHYGLIYSSKVESAHTDIEKCWAPRN